MSEFKDKVNLSELTINKMSKEIANILGTPEISEK